MGIFTRNSDVRGGGGLKSSTIQNAQLLISELYGTLILRFDEAFSTVRVMQHQIIREEECE
jgi:hypothetical protein